MFVIRVDRAYIYYDDIVYMYVVVYISNLLLIAQTDFKCN